MYFTYSLSCSGEHVVSYGAIVQVKRSDTWRSILTRVPDLSNAKPWSVCCARWRPQLAVSQIPVHDGSSGISRYIANCRTARPSVPDFLFFFSYLHNSPGPTRGLTLTRLLSFEFVDSAVHPYVGNDTERRFCCVDTAMVLARGMCSADGPINASWSDDTLADEVLCQQS
jgi:hypothetical protein